MVSLNFNDFFFLLNPITFILYLWVFFFKINNTLPRITQNNTTNIKIIKINSNVIFTYFYLFLLIYTYFSIYTIHGKNDLLWFSHFNLNNFSLNLFHLFFFIGFILFYLLKSTVKKTNLTKCIDYIFSINNLIILFPYLFCVNTIFTFLFIIELISAILLYKLISSKIWFKKNNKSKVVENNIPQNYINMVFFQYWVTFFSTIFIVYFYINIFYIYGTSDWFLIQFFNSIGFANSHTDGLVIRFLIVVFIISIFFKLGVTPFHLFKVEVYKGIPYLSIFFYTTYYFIVFFVFFMYLMSDFLAFFVNQYFVFLLFILFLGSFYVVVLLFDVSFLKVFFTYSTVINTIAFFVAFVANL